MVRTNTYWQNLDNLWLFEKGLARIPRRYYLDLIDKYHPATFLDSGCGLGTTYRLFRKSGVEIEYTGIDITPKFVAYCKKRFPDATFRRASINSIPFEDNSFHMVACRAVLEHLPSPYRAIAEMARVGRILIVTWFKKPRIKERLRYREKAGVWENVYSRKKIMDTLVLNNLRLVDEFDCYRHVVWVMEKGTLDE